LEQAYGAFPKTVLSLTGTGQHYLFQHPGPLIRNSVETLGDGLDVRGDGGFIIAPPSLHASGRRYAWEVQHDPAETTLAPMPGWLMTLCQETKRLPALDPGEPIPKGQRNNALFRHGCRMRRQGFSQTVIAAALHALNRTQCQPPLVESEVEGIAASCSRYDPGSINDDTRPRPNGQRQQEPRDTQGPISFVPALLSFQELLKLDIPERKRYVEWLPERGLVMGYGPRGSGKTMLMLALAISLSTKTTFLKWPVHHATGVLFVDGEMPITELRERTVALAHNAIPQGLHFLTSEAVYEKLGADLVLTGQRARMAVEEILDANPNIRVVILDNVSCLFSGIDEDKKTGWEPINGWLVRLRHRGLSVVLVHHAGKGGQQRGTSGREDSLDTVLSIEYPQDYRPEDGCHFVLRFKKSRSVKGDAVAPIDVRLEGKEGVPTWIVRPLEESAREQVESMLTDGMSPAEIATELGVSRSYAYRVKRDMVKTQETKT
jgi:putative DNA primase/helicase